MLKAIKNFFLVNRALLHSDRWLREPFTRGQAWVDLFGLANYRPGHFRVRGIRVDVDRGQLAHSQATLAKRWKWSRGKVRRYLSELENGGDIVQQNTEVTTVITIVNYDTWQSASEAPTDEGDTADGQQTDSRRTSDGTHKNKKENKEKEKNNNYSPNSDEFGLSVLLLDLILERKPDYRKPDLQKWTEHIDRMIRLDGRQFDRIGEVIRWCQADDFWMNNILSTEKLRKQFDKLELRMDNHPPKHKTATQIRAEYEAQGRPI